MELTDSRDTGYWEETMIKCFFFHDVGSLNCGRSHTMWNFKWRFLNWNFQMHFQFAFSPADGKVSKVLSAWQKNRQQKPLLCFDLSGANLCTGARAACGGEAEQPTFCRFARGFVSLFNTQLRPWWTFSLVRSTQVFCWSLQTFPLSCRLFSSAAAAEPPPLAVCLQANHTAV